MFILTFDLFSSYFGISSKDWGKGFSFLKECVPYVFSNTIAFFPFQNKLKDLDPSYKMDLDLWACFAPSCKTALNHWNSFE